MAADCSDSLGTWLVCCVPHNGLTHRESTPSLFSVHLFAILLELLFDSFVASVFWLRQWSFLMTVYFFSHTSGNCVFPPFPPCTALHVIANCSVLSFRGLSVVTSSFFSPETKTFLLKVQKCAFELNSHLLQSVGFANDPSLDPSEHFKLCLPEFRVTKFQTNLV